MDYQLEISYYFTQLSNGFLHKNRAALLQLFRDYAESNKSLVIDAISKTNPVESEIFWHFIESVCDNFAEWRECFIVLFARLLDTAEKMKDPSPVINSLEAFHMLKEVADFAFVNEVKAVVKKHINTGNYPLKRFLVWFFSHCITAIDAGDIDLIKSLRFDDDIIVRYYAITSYNSYRGNPPDKGISDVDQLLIDISDVYSCDPLN
jgi:hypothetical protein